MQKLLLGAWAKMTIPNFKIKCSDTLMAELEKHCFSETKVEVGGFLVGHINGAVAEVTHVIPAEHSVGKSTQLTFTHDTWDALHSKMDSLDGTLIGWYHSHPNFGVFLSDHDQFIQQNFFKLEGNITIVIDPIRGRRGWFYSSNNKIVKYEKEVNTTRARLGQSATNSDENIEAVMGKSSGGVSVGKVVGISMITSLLGVFLGFGLNSATGSTATMQSQINLLTRQVSELQQILISEGIVKVVPQVIPTPEVTVKPSTPAKSSPSTKPSAATTKKAVTSETKTVQTPVEGAACNPKKDKKLPKLKLECDRATSKWVGYSLLSQPNSSDTKTGNN
jgi:proteasome lid subunit RPN8/RPN11